ncbi:MAG: hypothetical protein IPM83_15555 [Ignavibacteria bacterium]|nr:hypothetical protein [Ignavibacteria bacterium]
MIGTLSVAWRGKKLSEDPVFLERVAAGKVNLSVSTEVPTGEKRRNARGSLMIFLLAILCVVILGIFPGMVDVETGQAVMIVMLAASALIMLIFKAKADETVKNSIMRGGIVAVISILGVSWMGSSFFEGNRTEIVQGIGGIVEQAPWAFAIGLFVLSILLISQAATVVTLMPVAVALGMPLPFPLASIRLPTVPSSFPPTVLFLRLCRLIRQAVRGSDISAQPQLHAARLVTTISTTLIALALANILL